MLRFAVALGLLVACSGAVATPAASIVTGIAYAPDGTDAHRLDLYLPATPAGEPLVVFVHGGAFMYGDRQSYADVGRALANEGMAVVIPSYRLFPQTDAQGSTQDVARAIAWTLAHARDYGIDATGAILAGHSAGAQIVSMIGTHGRYLEAAGARLQSIAGVFSLAGAYDVRDLSGEPDTWQRVDGHIYGETPEDRARISPGLDIDPKSPAIEAACGTDDDPGSCPRTLYFVRRLLDAGVPAKAFREIGADHMGLLRAFMDPHDPLNAEFLSFARLHH